MNKSLLFVFFVVFPFRTETSVIVDGLVLNTKEEYWASGRPCACPDDRAKNGRCGRRAALCKDRGKHISNCDSTKIRSAVDYKRVQNKLCY